MHLNEAPPATASTSGNWFADIFKNVSSAAIDIEKAKAAAKLKAKYPVPSQFDQMQRQNVIDNQAASDRVTYRPTGVLENLTPAQKIGGVVALGLVGYLVFKKR
jgi:hypothetical protein